MYILFHFILCGFSTVATFYRTALMLVNIVINRGRYKAHYFKKHAFKNSVFKYYIFENIAVRTKKYLVYSMFI